MSRIYAGAAGEMSALRQVDLRIRARQFVAVVGRSGSGKSTLLNLIAGIERVSAGQLQVLGTPIAELSESELAIWRGRRVGVVFQFFQLLPTLSVLENVMLPMDFVGGSTAREARRRALALLELVGMAARAQALPGSLSGGEQQRVAIARALANDPPLILADEPTGNLDTSASAAVLALLRAQVERGKSVLMVTHERDIAPHVDSVVELRDGKVVAVNRGGHS